MHLLPSSRSSFQLFPLLFIPRYVQDKVSGSKADKDAAAKKFADISAGCLPWASFINIFEYALSVEKVVFAELCSWLSLVNWIRRAISIRSLTVLPGLIIESRLLPDCVFQVQPMRRCLILRNGGYTIATGKMAWESMREEEAVEEVELETSSLSESWMVLNLGKMRKYPNFSNCRAQTCKMDISSSNLFLPSLVQNLIGADNRWSSQE